MAALLPVVVRKADFIREFQKLAPHRHRYEVFRDFVHMSAFSLVNAWPYTRSETIEAEFATIKAKYSPEEFTGFTRLLALLRELLEPEPRDILGQLYMSLELGNENTGQFFTPPGNPPDKPKAPEVEFSTKEFLREAVSSTKCNRDERELEG